MLSAFSLRLAVSGVSPVLDRVREDVALDAASIGVLAMVPTLGFALTGFLTAAAMRRVSLEALLSLASALAALGLIARAVSSAPVPFLGFSLLIMIGLGIALLSSAIPYSLELMALRHLASGTFGVLLSLEPAAAALAGLVVLGQVLQPLQLAGMALVVLASILVLGRGRRRAGGQVPGPAEVA